LKKAIALIGILLVLTGTYLVYAVTETKGRAAVVGPTPGTQEAQQWAANEARYQQIAVFGFVMIVVGSLLGIPLILSTP